MVILPEGMRQELGFIMLIPLQSKYILDKSMSAEDLYKQTYKQNGTNSIDLSIKTVLMINKKIVLQKHFTLLNQHDFIRHLIQYLCS